MHVDQWVQEEAEDDKWVEVVVEEVEEVDHVFIFSVSCLKQQQHVTKTFGYLEKENDRFHDDFSHWIVFNLTFFDILELLVSK